MEQTKDEIIKEAIEMVEEFCKDGCKAIDMDKISTGNIAHYKGNAKAHYDHFNFYFKKYFTKKLEK